MDLQALADAMTPEGIAELTRQETYAVPADPQPSEVGWTAEVRRTAVRLLDITGCTTWTAETSEPLYPNVAYVVRTHQERYDLDGGRFLVEVTKTAEVCGREHWTVTVNGQPIPHRAVRGRLPYGTEALALSLWYHLNLYAHEPCDVLTCRNQPIHAVYGGGYCAEHLHLSCKCQ
ncbi:MAG: hypothetical protein HOV96_19410 [Nonomuraea sp.]|nr:hypothetical protein [Nonomuraea sp.]NUR59335.1 hypothetical protein [Catenulispora sp.]